MIFCLAFKEPFKAEIREYVLAIYSFTFLWF